MEQVRYMISDAAISFSWNSMFCATGRMNFSWIYPETRWGTATIRTRTSRNSSRSKS